VFGIAKADRGKWRQMEIQRLLVRTAAK